MNESLTDKLIRELREENKKLMEMLKQMQSGERGKHDQQGTHYILFFTLNSKNKF